MKLHSSPYPVYKDTQNEWVSHLPEEWAEKRVNVIQGSSTKSCLTEFLIFFPVSSSQKKNLYSTTMAITLYHFVEITGS